MNRMKSSTPVVGIILLAGILLVGGCSRSITYEISGVIKSSVDGTVLSNVQIDMSGDGRIESPKALLTDADGKFAFQYSVSDASFMGDAANLPNWNLLLSKEGFRDEAVDISPTRQPTGNCPERIIVVAYLRPGKTSNAAKDLQKQISFGQVLDLRGSDINDSGIEPITEIDYVRVLYLAKTKVTNSGLIHLIGLKQLEELYLHETVVGNEGLKQISQLPELRKLDLKGTQVTDAGLKHLKQLQKLKVLYLSDTAVTDDGIAALIKLSGLRELHLDGTQITSDGINRLRIALTNCKLKT